MSEQIIGSKRITSSAYSFSFYYGFFFTKEYDLVRQNLLSEV